MAEANNPGLDRFRSQHLASLERVELADALPDPKLQVTYFGESVQTRTGPQEAIYSVSQTLPWWGKLNRKADYAESEASAAEDLYQSGRLQLRREVAYRYYELGYLAQSILSTEANLKLLGNLAAITDERVRGGESLNELLRINLEVERKRDLLDGLTQSRESGRAQLAALLALPVESLPELAELTADSDTLPEREALQLALEAKNPELSALRRGIESARYRSELARLERYPDFTFGLNYIQVGSALAVTPDAGKDPWSVSLAVSLPIWGGKNSAARKEASALRDASQAHYEERMLQLKADLSVALAKFKEARVRIDRYDTKLIPLAEQAMENTQSGYANSMQTMTDLIDSERSLLEVQLIYWRAVADLEKAKASIRALIGANT
jgi:outer membrane protein TolC